MGITRLLAPSAMLLALAACAPATAGPDLPRPVGPPPVVTTTTIPVTTTTVDPADLMASQCPTEFCLLYEIRDGARWSNGTPVTPADFARTFELFADPLANPPSPGYDLIESIDIVDDTRARVVFSEPFGAWQELFSRLLPAGADPSDLTAMPTSGPFRFVEWVPGDRIVVRRDPAWWSTTDLLTGGPMGAVNEVVFVFYPDRTEMLGALEEGLVDVISMRPDLDVMDRLAAMDTVSHVVAPGPLWEHVAFHHQDPVLAQPWARRSIAMAIDREAILDATIRPFDPAATGLGNTVWMANTVHYEDHYEREFSSAAAEQLLVANGCQRGADGVHVCRGNRMSFTWATTNDDPARTAIFQSARANLAEIGIEIVGDFRSPSEFVTREFLFGGGETWQMIDFSWRLGSDPIRQNETYRCGESDLNINRFCSTEVEELIESTVRITDPAERAAVYNEADRLYLAADAVIPLYQQPTLMAWGTDVSGPAPNWAYSTDLWNLASWTGKESVVVALPAEPGALDPLSSADEAANMVLSALFYGAHGMTPTHEHIPVLISSAQVVEGPD